jgi:alkanesulfonate monooxygenase SsuD/methylene tetrahydromethanopterin reductase-like flavin-dependent oxidoreductase (luciferase family)
MHNRHKLKLGFFGANCSSGRFVTTVRERWTAAWDDMHALGVAADEAGIDFLLPIARWKGYGGDTDYQGSAYETITWATGLLAATRNLTVFGTVHVPLFHPLIAAKQMVTADHVGHGRFGLNIVCGWNEGEFAMFGVEAKDHEGRYRMGQEWIDVVKTAWARDDFDYTGEFYSLRGVREKPKPYGGSRPLIMNAGTSPAGRSFAIRNCDALFTGLRSADEHQLSQASEIVEGARAEARTYGRDLDVYTVGVLICRPTRAEAEEYHRYAVENADWGAVDNIIAFQGHSPKDEEERERMRRHFAEGLGGLPLIGSPDEVAEKLAALSRAGFTGVGVSPVNYAEDLPYIRAELLPRLERLGLRTPSG